jgi:hypothetical protein
MIIACGSNAPDGAADVIGDHQHAPAVDSNGTAMRIVVVNESRRDVLGPSARLRMKCTHDLVADPLFAIPQVCCSKVSPMDVRKPVP